MEVALYGYTIEDHISRACNVYLRIIRLLESNQAQWELVILIDK